VRRVNSMSRQQAHGRIPLQNQSPLGGRLAGTLAVKGGA
jgi:hypothetical protein